jgi:hypothetical protein
LLRLLSRAIANIEQPNNSQHHKNQNVVLEIDIPLSAAVVVLDHQSTNGKYTY